MKWYMYTSKLRTPVVDARDWLEAQDILLPIFNEIARIRGYSQVVHSPGMVAGDILEENHVIGQSLHGVRDGHGTVVLQQT